MLQRGQAWEAEFWRREQAWEVESQHRTRIMEEDHRRQINAKDAELAAVKA